MRGELPTVKDSELGSARLLNRNLVFWGDTDSNSALKPFLEDSPVRFQNGQWFVKGAAYGGDRFVPSLVFPSRKGSVGWRYIVLNSGLTFREAHDRTNSQQNPKLPDWAIIDITQAPDANAPGRIHDADFFDEQWQFKRQPKPATE